MNNKLVLPVSTLASAAAAFGLGAMIFTNGNGPADAATPQPTTTVTAPAKPAEKPADAHETSTRTAEAKAGTAGVKAGAQGPFKDAQGDGKYMDDFGKTVMPNGLPVRVPDELLPWEEQYVAPTTELPAGVVPAQPEGTYTDPDAGTDTSDDVVSGPNIITDPDKPWFDLPTEAPTSGTVVEADPVVSGPVVSGPVRNPGMVTGPRPVFNSPTEPVSSVLPE